jgi:hypothetical protein
MPAVFAIGGELVTLFTTIWANPSCGGGGGGGGAGGGGAGLRHICLSRGSVSIMNIVAVDLST